MNNMIFINNDTLEKIFSKEISSIVSKTNPIIPQFGSIIKIHGNEYKVIMITYSSIQTYDFGYDIKEFICSDIYVDVISYNN